jgi:hypothetical protein
MMPSMACIAAGFAAVFAGRITAFSPSLTLISAPATFTGIWSSRGPPLPANLTMPPPAMPRFFTAPPQA